MTTRSTGTVDSSEILAAGKTVIDVIDAEGLTTEHGGRAPQGSASELLEGSRP